MRDRGLFAGTHLRLVLFFRSRLLALNKTDEEIALLVFALGIAARSGGNPNKRLCLLSQIANKQCRGL